MLQCIRLHSGLFLVADVLKCYAVTVCRGQSSIRASQNWACAFWVSGAASLGVILRLLWAGTNNWVVILLRRREFPQSVVLFGASSNLCGSVQSSGSTVAVGFAFRLFFCGVSG